MAVTGIADSQARATQLCVMPHLTRFFFIVFASTAACCSSELARGMSKRAVTRRHQCFEFVRGIHRGNIGLPFLHLLRIDWMLRSREVGEHLIVGKHFGERIQVRAVRLGIPNSA